MWRPMVLWTSVGASAADSRISPYGTRPVLMRAWKPLQMPRIRPSRFLIRSMMASATRGLRMMVAMNLAEPSGSSPALKPPGNMRIWDWRIFSARAARDSSMCFTVRLRNTRISASAPASRKALAESYSLFVPGNAGIKTFGFEIVDCGLRIEDDEKSGASAISDPRSSISSGFVG